MRSRDLLLFSALLPLSLACGSAAADPSNENPGGSGGTANGQTPGGDGDGDDANGEGSGSASPATGGQSTNGPAPRQRVVGYLPTYRNLDPSRVDWTTLTHLCIAFANPREDGAVDFTAPSQAIHDLVTAAHSAGVKVLASIAGAAEGAAVAARITPPNVDGFVDDLLALAERYDLDGIDVDIEGNYVSATYEPFVLKLSAALDPNLLLTAAVATWNGDDFSDAALAEYDFINLMSYDHCGTWTQNPCEHSSIARSLEELAYWEGARGIEPERMVLGVPFYGYCWGAACTSGNPSAMTFAEIIEAHPSAATMDYLTGEGYAISFNSPLTMAAKAELAKEHGGIMIWELAQDAAGELSLFSVIARAQ